MHLFFVPQRTTAAAHRPAAPDSDLFQSDRLATDVTATVTVTVASEQAAAARKGQATQAVRGVVKAQSRVDDVAGAEAFCDVAHSSRGRKGADMC